MHAEQHTAVRPSGPERAPAAEAPPRIAGVGAVGGSPPSAANAVFRSTFKESLGELAFINHECDWTIADGVRHSMELSACMNTLAIFLRGPKCTTAAGDFHPARKLVWTLAVTGDDIGEVAVDSSWVRDADQTITFKLQYLPQTILDNIQIQFPKIYERLLDAADDDSTDSGGSDDDDDDDGAAYHFEGPGEPSWEDIEKLRAAKSAAEPEVIDLVNDEPAEPVAPPAAEAQPAAKRVNEWGKLVEGSNELERLVYVRTVEEPAVFEGNLELQMRITKYLHAIIANCTMVLKRTEDMMIKNFKKFAKEKNNKKRKR